MRVQIRKKLFWSVRLLGDNGEALLTSETYFNKSNARRAGRELAYALGTKLEEK